MFSATTTELSTKSPTHRTNPMMVRLFKVFPAKNRAVVAMSRHSGIAREITIVMRNWRKKKNNTSAARTAPVLPLLIKALRRATMSSPWLS